MISMANDKYTIFESIILSAQIYEIWTQSILHEHELLWIRNMKSIEIQYCPQVPVVVENLSILDVNNNFIDL